MKNMEDPATQAGAAAIGSVMSLGLDPGSDAGQRHVNALLPGMLRHFSSRASSTADPAPDDDAQAPPSAGGLTMADVDQMTPEEVSERWPEVAAVFEVVASGPSHEPRGEDRPGRRRHGELPATGGRGRRGI